MKRFRNVHDARQAVGATNQTGKQEQIHGELPRAIQQNYRSGNSCSYNTRNLLRLPASCGNEDRTSRGRKRLNPGAGETRLSNELRSQEVHGRTCKEVQETQTKKPGQCQQHKKAILKG